MQTIDLNSYQTFTERKFSKKNISGVVENDLTDDQDMIDLIEQCAEHLKAWCEEDHYASKNARLAELAQRDMVRVVIDILCVTSLYDYDAELTSVVGQCAGTLKMSNKYHGITTCAEILAIMSEFDFFDLYKADTYDSIMFHNNVELSEQTFKHVHETKYLPPMVIKPKTVKSNYDNFLLTEKTSMILGKGTHHDGDICLDTLNKFNAIPLCLNQRVLTTLSEVPKNADMDEEAMRQWHTFVKDSYRIYRDLIQVGNKFHLGHKVDKRGRTYAQGYHVSTQGNQFRKAICEFAEKEVIEL